MKKLLLPFFFSITSISFAFSQNYKLIEWEIAGVSLIAPSNENNGTTLGFHTEVRFNLNDKLSLGLKAENHFFNADMFGEPIRGFGISRAQALTFDYYFHNNINKRAFAGIALGSYDNSAKTESGVEVGGRGFGITPRVGYEFSIFRLTGEYNFTFRDDFPNYLGLRLGINIGGRFKK